jgi:hypothetical protein
MDGQIQRERGSHTRFALDLDPASVCFGQFPADGQSQPDALGFGGEERLEEFFHIFGRDADASILDSDQYPVISEQCIALY